ncbi:MAG: hypothetical protein LC650_02505 [Actinobacteria bacterium]|nr:hypothetical protein [Actinomycetota bacterium]
MKVQLFTDGSYYYTPTPPTCDACAEQVLRLGWQHLSWFDKRRNRHPEERVFCNSCMDHGRDYGSDAPEKHPFVVEKPPSGAQPYMPMPPTLADGKGTASNFDFTSLPPSTDRDDDLTRAAGRPEYSLDGPVSIGLPESEVRTPDDDPRGALLLTAAPIIPEQLEDKS